MLVDRFELRVYLYFQSQYNNVYLFFISFYWWKSVEVHIWVMINNFYKAQKHFNLLTLKLLLQPQVVYVTFWTCYTQNCSYRNI